MGSTRHWKYDDLTAGIDLSYIKESSTNSKAGRSHFLLCLTHKAVMTSFNDCWEFGCRWKSAHKYGLQVMYVYTVSLCLQGVEGTVFTGQAEAKVEMGHMEALFGGPFLGAVGRPGIGYSQNYFHMVQRPLIMSCTIMAWLPPSQHYPFHPCLSG